MKCRLSDKSLPERAKRLQRIESSTRKTSIEVGTSCRGTSASRGIAIGAISQVTVSTFGVAVVLTRISL
eukprot:8508495-Pyramimonas_sp.AAC.1